MSSTISIKFMLIPSYVMGIQPFKGMDLPPFPSIRADQPFHQKGKLHEIWPLPLHMSKTNYTFSFIDSSHNPLELKFIWIDPY